MQRILKIIMAALSISPRNCWHHQILTHQQYVNHEVQYVASCNIDVETGVAVITHYANTLVFDVAGIHKHSHRYVHSHNTPYEGSQGCEKNHTCPSDLQTPSLVLRAQSCVAH